MIKKKLNILFFTLLLVLFLGSFSTSYATINFSEVNEVVDKLCNGTIFSKTANAQSIKNIIYNNFNNKTSWGNNWFFAKVKTADNVSYVNGVLFFGSRINNPNLGGADQLGIFFNVNGGTLSTGNNAWMMKSFDYYYSTATFNYSTYWGIAPGEVGGKYVTEPDIYFIPGEDYVVTFKNTNNVNAILRNYSINQWKIGETYDFGDLDSFHFYFYDLTNNVETGRIFYYKSNNSLDFSGSLYYMDNDLYVNSRYINYKTLYRLDVSKFLEGNEYTESHYFVFAPRDASVVNGVITDFGSGDYSVQDSTNDIIDSNVDSSALDNTIAELSESGELVKRLNYKVYPNHSYDILFALTQNICDTLYASGDTYIDIDVHNYHHRFYASDFYIPLNGLTYWIYLAIIFGYCYLLYRQGAELIHAIQEGDLYVLELEDANEYFYM